jgi:hypothetical protein
MIRGARLSSPKVLLRGGITKDGNRSDAKCGSGGQLWVEFRLSAAAQSSGETNGSRAEKGRSIASILSGCESQTNTGMSLQHDAGIIWTICIACDSTIFTFARKKEHTTPQATAGKKRETVRAYWNDDRCDRKHPGHTTCSSPDAHPDWRKAGPAAAAAVRRPALYLPT